MAVCEKIKQSEFTEKAKKWVNECGRKSFTINKITKDTYTCSLHFVGGNGPTEEDLDPGKDFHKVEYFYEVECIAKG